MVKFRTCILDWINFRRSWNNPMLELEGRNAIDSC